MLNNPSAVGVALFIAPLESIAQSSRNGSQVEGKGKNASVTQIASSVIALVLSGVVLEKNLNRITWMQLKQHPANSRMTYRATDTLAYIALAMIFHTVKPLVSFALNQISRAVTEPLTFTEWKDLEVTHLKRMFQYHGLVGWALALNEAFNPNPSYLLTLDSDRVQAIYV